MTFLWSWNWPCCTVTLMQSAHTTSLTTPLALVSICDTSWPSA
eukprot:CAMPEP_0203902980 /NCGR_PEP_ID=MMETSP0359-20131031/44981_1 /ASSEMBLY_ACC=CAM_ASM_000338 /TAXON_ID=268821 /ORGANISM="Scrippsiella Hangoei, Strain SHTV-5" /LENGTH=42 /DNA_ID= /DNA_START= /DNA_END= /DNA_ORIENTATION=